MRFYERHWFISSSWWLPHSYSLPIHAFWNTTLIKLLQFIPMQTLHLYTVPLVLVFVLLLSGSIWIEWFWIWAYEKSQCLPWCLVHHLSLINIHWQEPTNPWARVDSGYIYIFPAQSLHELGNVQCRVKREGLGAKSPVSYPSLLMC